MRQQATRQKSLFEEMEEVPTPQLPAAVRHEVAQRLRQWLQALAKAIGQEHGDE